MKIQNELNNTEENLIYLENIYNKNKLNVVHNKFHKVLIMNTKKNIQEELSIKILIKKNLKNYSKSIIKKIKF